MKKSLGIQALLLCAAFAAGQENYTQWGFYKDITVNTKASGANVAGVVTNFPLLLRFGAADSAVFAQAGAGGASLRFTKMNGITRLPHQIDTWNAATRSGAVWVRLDSVKANDSTASLRMYWSRSTAADSSKGSSVFDTANGFRSVLHMGGDSTAPRPNAVAGAPAATPVNFPAGYTPKVGLIGLADTLRGGSGNVTTDYLTQSGTGYTGFSDFTNFTVSAWVYSAHTPAQSFTGARFIEMTSTADGNDRFYLSHNVATNGGKAVTLRWNTGNGTSNGVQGPSTGADTIQVGAWQHFLVSRAGTATPVLYKNGHVVTTTAATSSTSAIPVTLRNFVNIGRSFTANDPVFTGKLDEITVSTAARSADWAKLTYETQKAAAGAVVFGATQIGAVPTAITNLRYVPANTATNDTVIFQTGVPVNIVPTYAGGPVDSFAISGSLPPGITFNRLTGALTGNAIATIAVASRTVTAYGAGGNATRVLIRSAVVGPLAAFDYSDDTVSVATGTAMTALYPFWNIATRAPTGFSISGTLPAGIRFNTNNGSIAGVPTAAAAAANFTVKAFNAIDTVSKVIRLTVTASAADGAYATAWSGHTNVFLNTTAGGANVTGNVTNFPVLIRLGAADSAVFAGSNASGRDIRFTKADNTTRLMHEIEYWDAATKSAAVWVRLDTVYGNNATQRFRMHWGNTAAANLSNGPAVFDTANGFLAVYHLGSTVATAARANSAGGHPAVPKGPAVLGSQFPMRAGVIGLADTLRRGTGTGVPERDTSDHFNLGAGFNNFGSQLTFSGWFYAVSAASGDWEQYVSLGNSITSGTSSNNVWMGREGTTANNFAAEVFTGNAAHRRGEGAITLDTWQYLTWTLNGTTTALYKNGAALTPTSTTTAVALVDIVRPNNYIGRSNWPDRNVPGKFDEIRIAKTARSADWEKLSYENQKPGATMVTFSNVTGVQGSPLSAGSALSVKAIDGGLLFQVRSENASRTRLSIVDMHGRTVWNRVVQAGAGTSQFSWNGRSNDGQALGAGIFVARMSLLDATGKATHSLQRKVPLTR